MCVRNANELRFDVETIYKATTIVRHVNHRQLRFDVETIYKATLYFNFDIIGSCGLM